MLLKGTCKKCNGEMTMDIGDMTVEEVIAELKVMKEYSCHAGNHVELGSPYPDDWDVENWELVEGKAPSEEEFLAKLKREYSEVRETDQMGGIIEGFSCGFPVTNDGNCWKFTHSPKGTRYYYCNPK